MNMMETDQDSKYLPQLQAEKDTMDSSFIHAHRLLAKEIDRIESGGSDTASKQETVYLEVHHEPPKPVKKTEKVLIPIKEHPKFNFVGKLLGPKGLTLKRLQEETGTKMAILGKGSMKDKRKEDELRKEGGKYNHLNDELHVSIEVFAPLPECYRRISHAIAELHKYLMPDFNDEIRQQQMEEMMYLNGEEGNGAHPPAVPMRGRGRGRGAPGGPPPGGMGRGRGAGPPGPLLSTPMPPPRGGGAPRGAPPSRGGMSSRGAPTSRGGPMSRGAPRAPVPLGRGGPVSRAPPPVSRPYEEESYGYGSGGGGGGGGMASMSGSGVASYDDQSYGYEEQSYGGGESYDQGGYSSAAGGSDTQYFDYGHGSSSRDEYQEESYGQESWGGQQASYGKAPVARPKPTDYRSHPYGGGNNTSRGRY